MVIWILYSTSAQLCDIGIPQFIKKKYQRGIHCLSGAIALFPLIFYLYEVMDFPRLLLENT